MILANILGFGNPLELGIIAGVIVLLFGGSKIAGFGKSLGEGLNEFKKATKDPVPSEQPNEVPVVPVEPTKTVE